MKTVIIYGVEHRGSSYNAVQLFKNKLNLEDKEVTEYFLPKDLPHFCVGCNNCFMKGEELCPHRDYVTPIKETLYNAELIILASPVYVFHVSGQMKAFLDHLAFQFMVHRPNKTFFSKTALVISIGAGGGMSSTIKDMTLCLKNWGVSNIFTFGFAIFAVKWEDVSEKKRLKIEQKIEKISKNIQSKINKKKPGLKIKLMFLFFRYMQKKFGYIPYDKAYWEGNGWLAGARPWN